MDDQCRRRQNTFQNLAIVVLAVLGVLLFTKTQLYNLHFNRSDPAAAQLAGPAGTAAQTTKLTDLSVPVRLAVSGSYGRHGSLCLTTADETFAPFGAVLRTAIASAGQPEPCSQEDFRHALTHRSIYCDFGSPLPLELLAGLLGTWNGHEAEAQRLVLSADGERVSLFLWDGRHSWSRCRTVLTGKDLDVPIPENGLEDAVFAMDNAEADRTFAQLDPYSLLIADNPAPPVLSAVNPLTDVNSLLSALGFNPHTKFRYTEANGTISITEGSSSLHIQTDGTVLFRGGTGADLEIRSDDATPTVSEAAVGAEALLRTLLGSAPGSAALYLTGVQQAGSMTTVSFGYQCGGLPIHQNDGSDAAQVILSGRDVMSFSLHFRQYTATEQPSLLLPLPQAAAIAAKRKGAELTIGYTDSGESTVSAGWLAEQSAQR